MTCSEVERVLPELLEGAPDSAFQNAFEIHLRTCPDCSGLVSDLKMISRAAGQLAESEEPSPRIWLGIAAQLRAEGIIRDPALQAPQASRSYSPWRAWWLAAVAAALLAAGAYLLDHRPAPQVAKQEVPATTVSPATSRVSPTSSNTETAKSLPPAVPSSHRVERISKPPRIAETHSVEPPTSGATEVNSEDQQFLSVVSTRAPSMRATYEKQLRDVNAEIREVQAYLRQNPGDQDARQHLMDAFEQKALLYQIALDRIQ